MQSLDPKTVVEVLRPDDKKHNSSIYKAPTSEIADNMPDVVRYLVAQLPVQPHDILRFSVRTSRTGNPSLYYRWHTANPGKSVDSIPIPNGGHLEILGRQLPSS